MRFVIIGGAVLVGLGLAAFGALAAFGISVPQLASETQSLTASVIAPSAPAPLTRLASNDKTVPAQTPFHQLAQSAESGMSAPKTTGMLQAQAEPTNVPPVRLAQTTPAQSNSNQAAAGAPSTNSAKAAAAGPPPSGIAACDKPGGMGLSRIVEIDTTGGPGFGFEHFKQYDFLRDKEVVLTFDDGPWPENTMAVVKALTDNCLKATFFEIGEHATWHPEITKRVIAAGMTVGSHTWSHKDLAKNPYASDIELAKQEIEMGISAVHMAADAPIAPFFRFPDLQHPPQLLAYLAERNIGVFSTDIDSFDFKLHKPEQVIKSVMTKLEKHGKGIILMHDFQKATGEAMPELLRQLKAGGYKVVHLVPHQPVTTLPKYDEMLMQQDKMSVNNTRPESSVFHTIGEYKGSPAPASAVHD